MAKSEALNDKIKSKVVREELNRFIKLIEGHMKLLRAIGNL